MGSAFGLGATAKRSGKGGSPSTATTALPQVGRSLAASWLAGAILPTEGLEDPMAELGAFPKGLVGSLAKTTVTVWNGLERALSAPRELSLCAVPRAEFTKSPRT